MDPKDGDELPSSQSGREPLGDAESRLLAIINGSDDAISAALLDGTVITWNRGAELLYGYTAEEAIGSNIAFLFPSGQIDQLESIQDSVAAGSRSDPISGQRIRKDGTLVDIELRVTPITNERGAIIGMSGIARDVSERKRLEREREAERDFLTLTQELSGVGAWRTQLTDGAPMQLTAEMYRIFGLEPMSVVSSHDAYDLVHPDDRDLLSQAGGLTIASGQQQDCEFRIIRPDGALRWVYAVIKADTDSSGSPIGLVGACRDITEAKQLEDRLAHDSLHDSLTDLPNRALLLDRIGHALKRAEQHGGLVTVYFVDLDRFKAINDSRGHDFGDAVLQAAANRLKSHAHATDTVGRLSGDEFIFVSEENLNAVDAAERAVSLHAAFREPLEVAGSVVHMATSVGVAIGQPNSTPESLIRDADLAMYRAKERGRNRVEFYDIDLRERAERRIELESDLWEALESDALSLEYQPIVSLVEGRYVGVEALLRWKHPLRGNIGPSEFITLAEETGLIVPVGNWVLRTAMQELQGWKELRQDLPLRLSVNVSPVQLRRGDFAVSLAEAIASTQFDPTCLQLELTESALLDAELASNVLIGLDALGIRIAIDDFGVGYSSLAYLRELPIDELKIDRSFVAHMTDEQSSLSIVSAIIAIGRSLDIQVTAEGVETEAQLALLRELGCHSAQGFYFSHPLPPEACVQVLREAPRLD